MEGAVVDKAAVLESVLLRVWLMVCRFLIGLAEVEVKLVVVRVVLDVG
jgi:hypothetical protein